jgi:hypothetical protein
MTGRARTSTLVISGLFLAVLALYFLVRPVQVPAGEPQPYVSPTRSAAPTLTPSSTRTTPSPSRSPSRSPSVSPSATPSGSVTAPASPTPGESQTTTPPVLNPLPTTTAPSTP